MSAVGPDRRRVCLVTGASSGIGEAFAHVFARAGYDVVLVARRIEKLHAVAKAIEDETGSTALCIGADLSIRGAVGTVLGKIHDSGLIIDAVVNNAGFGTTTQFAQSDWQSEEAYLQLMVGTVCELCHALLPNMLSNAFGRIINVSPTSAFMPGGGGTTLYGGAKSLLVLFSESLHVQTHASGVHVTALCPGATYSEFHDVMNIRSVITQATSTWMWQSSDEVASAGFRAVERNDPLCIPGLWNTLFVTWHRLVPHNFWVRRAIRKRARRAAGLGASPDARNAGQSE